MRRESSGKMIMELTSLIDTGKARYAEICLGCEISERNGTKLCGPLYYTVKVRLVGAKTERMCSGMM